MIVNILFEFSKYILLNKPNISGMGTGDILLKIIKYIYIPKTQTQNEHSSIETTHKT